MGDLVHKDYGTRDPAAIGYPPTLPIEVAMKVAPLPAIKDAYGFTDEEWAALQYDPAFLADLSQAAEMVKREGMTFKLKAKLQAEELLKTSWKLIHDIATPPNVKADLIKSTARWAGFDQKDLGGSGGNAFNIQINLK